MIKERKKYTFTTGRVILIIVLAIVQVTWFASLLTSLAEYATWLDRLLRIFSVFIILYLVRKDENPEYRNSWIILLLVVPLFGGLFYLMFGNKRPAKKMATKLKEQMQLHQDEMMDEPIAINALTEFNERYAGLSRYINKQSKQPAFTDSLVDYYPSGESAMDDLISTLESAEKYIFLEFFIIKLGKMSDRIFSVLEQKAAEGVDVRLIYDDFGCLTTFPEEYVNELRLKGIKCYCFNPFTPIISLAVNTRDHRKIVVVDGKVGFTGGLNIADEYINEKERFGYWKDNMIRITGPAVWNLTTMFLDMWNAFVKTDEAYDVFKPYNMASHSVEGPQQHGFVQVFGDSPLDSESLGENVYSEIMNMAKDYVYIYTPYLVISHSLQHALVLAAKRGLDIRLMTPGIPDKKMVYRITRSYYKPLIKAGVKIYEYTPGFLHAKTFVSDDTIATVGSINLDYRSLYLHFELNAVMYYHSVIPEIKADFLEAESQSRRISLEDCRGTLLGELWDSILRLIAPFV